MECIVPCRTVLHVDMIEVGVRLSAGIIPDQTFKVLSAERQLKAVSRSKPPRRID